DLLGPGHVADARGDVHGHPADVAADELALPGVQAGADLDAQAADRGDDGARAAQGVGRRALERGDVAVADGLDLAAAVALDLAADRAVVGGQQVAPAPVAHACGVAGCI